nr:PAS domain S-box protein [Chthoniobacterales bacterium]
VLSDLTKVEREVKKRDNGWFLARLSPYRTLDHKINGVVVSFIDITESRFAREAVRESEEQFRRAIQEAPIPVIMQAEDGQVLQISRAWTELTGYTAEEIPTFEAWVNRAYGAGGEEVRRRMERLFHGETPMEQVVFEIRTRGGESRFWSLSASSPGTLRDGRRFVVAMALDITGSRKADAALRISEDRFRAMADNISQLAWTCDQLGNVNWYNQRWLDYTGLTFDEMRDWGWKKVQHPDHVDRVVESVTRSLESGEPWEDTFPLRGQDGSYRWFLSRAQPIRDAEGRIIRWFGTNTDVTELRETQEKLRQTHGLLGTSEERLQLALAAADVGTFVWNIGDDRLLADEQLLKFFGLEASTTEAGLPLAAFTSRIHPDDRERVEKLIAEAVGHGAEYEAEYRLIGSDKKMRWVQARGRVERDAAGRPARFPGALIDITQRKAAEEELRLSQEKFELLVEGARDHAIFLIDPSNTIIHWNSGAERIFGWTAEEAIGRHGSLIFTPEDEAIHREATELEIAAREGCANDRRWHLRKDGNRVWIDGIMRRLDDEKGDLRGFAKIARDATEQRLAEEELKNSRADLERRVEKRTAELTATNRRLEAEMSQRAALEQKILLISEREKRRIGQDLHDSLCQELAAAAFFLQSAAQKNEKKNSAQSKVLAEAARIVNDNVGLARDLARGLHPVELTSQGLADALRELAFRTSQLRSVTCHFDCPRQIRIRDEAVALNFYRIAQEAVTNALKNGKASVITIKLTRDRKGLCLSVKDNGKGFSVSKTRSGMGLHIMKYRADVIGAELTVESADGKGAKVVCCLGRRVEKSGV